MTGVSGQAIGHVLGSPDAFVDLYNISYNNYY